MGWVETNIRGTSSVEKREEQTNGTKKLIPSNKVKVSK
jgi:hypothetical protein